ncbi:hypothetical protein P8452_49380 [Trifolium repens]|nr:hypothetical protein P8452_49380 [Trifolium repens]
MMMMKCDHCRNFLRPTTLYPCEGGWFVRCCNSCGKVLADGFFIEGTYSNSILTDVSEETINNSSTIRKSEKEIKIETHNLEEFVGSNF